MPGHGSTVTHGRISRSQVQHERTARHLRGEICDFRRLGSTYFLFTWKFFWFWRGFGAPLCPKLVEKNLKREAGDYASFENLWHSLALEPNTFRMQVSMGTVMLRCWHALELVMEAGRYLVKGAIIHHIYIYTYLHTFNVPCSMVKYVHVQTGYKNIYCIRTSEYKTRII